LKKTIDLSIRPDNFITVMNQYIAYNKLTGLYWQVGKGFTTSKCAATLLSPAELAVLNYTYDNVSHEIVALRLVY